MTADNQPTGHVTDCRKPMAGTTPMAVGDMLITRNVNGALWLENTSGEGMQLSGWQEISLRCKIQEWFKVNF